MIVTKIACPDCGLTLAVVSGAPRSDTASYFTSLMLEAVSHDSPPIGEDEPCPRCGCADVLSPYLTADDDKTARARSLMIRGLRRRLKP